MSVQRIKDASFLQQHIEKLILLAGILVFAIAVFLFVLGNPFAVEVNRKAYSKPAEAVDVLVRTDKQLENGLQDPKPIPEITPPDFRENFLAMIERDFDLNRRVAGLSNPGTTFDSLYPPPPTVSRYALVYPPAPKDVTFKSGTDVLDKEFDPVVTKRFFDMWGKELEEPGDFTMFVAAGEFDLWEWANRLKADPTEDETIKIPTGIWVQRFGIAGVALLREEWDPEQGVWVNRQIVTPLPGQVRLLPSEKVDSETNQAMMRITQLREAQLELAQPELPWLTDFVQVVPPGGEDDGRGVDGYLMALNEKNLGPAEKEILKLEEKIKDLRERQEAQNKRRQGGDRPPADFGGDFDAPPAPSPRDERSDPITRQIENLQERIERLRPQAELDAQNRTRMIELERRREEERKRREALRSERDRELIGPDGGGGLGLEGLSLQEDSTLRVWAADPSMQPGKTYRYKLLVAAINPLYAVPRLAPDQLKDNANRAALLPTEEEIAAMPWIGPIKVEPESRFFFTAGRDNGAKIEIYRRIDGELRVQNFDGSPGDSIGSIIEIENDLGAVNQFDMNVDSIIVDIEKRRDVFTGSTVYNLIYMDPDGSIHERIDVIDKSSPVRTEYRDEIKNGPDRVLRPSTDDIDPAGGDFDPSFRDF